MALLSHSAATAWHNQNGVAVGVCIVFIFTSSGAGSAHLDRVLNFSQPQTLSGGCCLVLRESSSVPSYRWFGRSILASSAGLDVQVNLSFLFNISSN